VRASPRWGAEPLAGNTWPTTGSDYLVYGYPTTGTNKATDGFELGTLPPGVINAGTTASNPINVGICAPTTGVDANGKPAANLLVHTLTNGKEILPLVKLAFCSQNVSTNTSASWFTRLASGVKTYFSPAIAFAQDGGDLFIGGLPSGWSPFQSQLFAASDVTLSFDGGQPGNTTTNSPPITVQVTAASATTLPPLNVRLTIAGNHGTPSFLINGADTTDHVDAPVVNGVATFSFGFTKAGGYTLTATGFLGGGAVATAPALSVLFQVQNK
jgi:hypothetical protein